MISELVQRRDKSKTIMVDFTSLSQKSKYYVLIKLSFSTIRIYSICTYIKNTIIKLKYL